MRKLTILFSLICTIHLLSGQTEFSNQIIGDVEPLSYSDVPPQFRDGNVQMYKFVFTHLRYPAEAREKNIQGKVIVQFAVDVDSTLKRVNIIQGIEGGCNEEVLRILKMMSDQKLWTPGKHEGRAVAVGFTLPVMFKLDTPESESKKKKKK